MGFFFRRSAKLGPIRLNLSKSGLGASVGVRGARLTLTPRGTTYITVGSHGFYYRETLSGSRQSSTPPSSPTYVPEATTRPGEIPTADASELVESSSQTLIQRLNERARMFNPAWVVFGLGLVLVFYGLSSSPQSGFSLPDPTEPASQKIGTEDQYVAIVRHYGYPDSVVASAVSGAVPMRQASYKNADVTIVLVPNACVEAYSQLARTSKGIPSLPRPPVRRCLAEADSGWSIVSYEDGSRNPLPAPVVKSRLDALPVKQSTAPLIESEPPPLAKKNQRDKAAVKSKAQPEPVKNTWSLPASVTIEEESNWSVANYLFLLGGMGLIGFGVMVHNQNKRKRLTRLVYELNEEQQRKYHMVQEAVAHLAACRGLWRIEASSATSDWKRNAGASSLVRRKFARAGTGSPPRVEVNLQPPEIDIGSAKMFFLPDLILYLQGGVFGAIDYQDFRVEQSTTTFIEDGGVPGDAVVVGQTWRYVNKNGGPDRRFNNNIQLPVVQYATLRLTSSRGLNIYLNASNVRESVAFANAWRLLGSKKSNERQQAEALPPPLPPNAQADSYRILGLAPNASPTEISGAYHRLAQMYHPDKVAGLAPEFQALAERRMKEINAAYASLRGRD